MTIYRGVGGGGDATSDIEISTIAGYTAAATVQAGLAETSATNAATSASNATTSAAAASTSATGAASSAASATSSASGASTSASAASTSASNASTSASAASTSATNAAASASTATTQASNASTSATNAAASASTATTQAGTATTQATNAATSASGASTSATNASNSATSASGSASTATTQASNASTSATNAASSASAASTSATNAANSATTAASFTPSQTGNSGKYLTTNGTVTSWGTVTSGSGTVTSVAATVPTFLSVAGSPITSSGTLAITLSGTALPVANGGTGGTTATAGFNALAPSQTSNSGKYLTTDGTNSSWATVVSGASVGMKNRIIDGGFTINQRVYVSGTSLASGTYGHDRWKGGASAGTYTFTQGALGVNTTITITAGSIIQVIEGCNLPEGGTYVLSWTGTAQGRLNGGTYGSSGTVTVTGWVAGTNLNVEFNTGTCGNVQLEKGSTASSFDYRPFGTELNLCQRYYSKSYELTTALAAATTTGMVGGGLGLSTIGGSMASPFPVQMRTAPTMAFWDSSGNASKVTGTANGTTMVANQSSSPNGPFNISQNNFWITGNGISTYAIFFHFAATAEL